MMENKSFKAIAVVLLVALALTNMCIEKKESGGAAANCASSGGSWEYSECASGCVPNTLQERLDRIKNPVSCPAVCYEDYVCLCPSGSYWASMEEGCIQRQIECVPEGKFVPSEGECCESLQRLAIMKEVEDGVCRVSDEGSVCADCGNGICGPGENKCNCPDDCGNT